MATPNLLPHTLDNLCKADKDKLVEMIKQLNELKKRCNALEQELDAARNENQRLSGREDIMKSQIDSMELKLFDAVEISKQSQARVEQLTAELQKSEAGRKSARARYRESQAEITTLRDNIRELKLKHERIHVDTSAQTKINTCTRGSNTDDTALLLVHQLTQTTDKRSPNKTQQSTELKSLPSMKTGSNSGFPPGSSFASSFDQGSLTEFDDEEISTLIDILNA